METTVTIDSIRQRFRLLAAEVQMIASNIDECECEIFKLEKELVVSLIRALKPVIKHIDGAFWVARADIDRNSSSESMRGVHLGLVPRTEQNDPNRFMILDREGELHILLYGVSLHVQNSPSLHLPADWSILCTGYDLEQDQQILLYLVDGLTDALKRALERTRQHEQALNERFQKALAVREVLKR